MHEWVFNTFFDVFHWARHPNQLHLPSFNYALHWRHNERDGVSNHRRPNGLFNRLFKPRSKKTSKLRVTGLCEGNLPVTGGFPHKGPVMRKMFQFDDVIMICNCFFLLVETFQRCQQGLYQMPVDTWQRRTHIYEDIFQISHSRPLLYFRYK